MKWISLREMLLLAVASVVGMSGVSAQEVKEAPPFTPFPPVQVEPKTDQENQWTPIPISPEKSDELKPPIIVLPSEVREQSPAHEFYNPPLPQQSSRREARPDWEHPVFRVQTLFESPDGRIALHMENLQDQEKLPAEKVMARAIAALAYVEEVMGEFDGALESEQIRIFVGSKKLSVPGGREVEGANIAGHASLVATLPEIRMTLQDANAETLRHEFAHLKMFDEGVVNIPYWLSEGWSHFVEWKMGYNHNTYRWLQFERPLTTERLTGAHASNNDSMRRRATGHALCFYMYHGLGEDWRQMARRTTYPDPQLAWDYTRSYFEKIDLDKQVTRLKNTGRVVPNDVLARLSAANSVLGIGQASEEREERLASPGNSLRLPPIR